MRERGIYVKLWKRDTVLNDRRFGKIASEYGKIKGIFSQDVSGHCDLFDVSKLSWSLVIDQIII